MGLSTCIAILCLAFVLIKAEAASETRTINTRINRLFLLVEYIWTAPNTDLDTNTVFLNKEVGHSCPRRSQFSFFFGDVRTTGGIERAVINVGAAVNADMVLGNARVDLRAHWSLRTGGDATVRVRPFPGGRSNSLTIPITPADNGSGCAREFVGSITVFPMGDSVEITLTNENDGLSAAGNGKYFVGGCTGDPHCSTFDALKFDCQGTGEFILVRNPTSTIQVQARFGERINNRVTLTEGIAVNFPFGPPVQISIARSTATTTTTVAGCPVAFFVDGMPRKLSDGTGSTGVILTNSGGRYTLTYPFIGSSEAALSITVGPRMFGGACYLEWMNLQISRPILANQLIVGLMGSPDDNPLNDWTTMDGTVLDPPTTTNERRNEPSYRYCVDNWCNRDASESIFTYETGTSHATFDMCDLPPPGQVNLAEARTALRQVCLGDEACLVEGLVGGLPAAQNFVVVRDTNAKAREAVSSLRFDPMSIAPLRPTRITVTLDVRDRPTSQLMGVRSFALFTINGDTGRVFSFLGELFDDGREIHSDETANDNIFTSSFTLFPFTAGESFSFRAVPVVGGERLTDSPLVQIRRDAVVANEVAARR